MQQCKKIMNAEIPQESHEQEYRSVEAVSVLVATASANVSQPGVSGASQPAQNEDEEGSDEDVDVVKVEACTTSTNASDDYAHRGPELASLTLYSYRMYVRRVRKPRPGTPLKSTIFLFEKHYALFITYAQEVVLHNVHVPTIDGFQCPTIEQDAEQNALLKTILFTPWSCTDPMTCGNVITYKSLLSNGSHPDAAGSDGASPHTACSYTFQRAWKLRSAEIHVLADRAQCRCMAARQTWSWRMPLYSPT